MNRKDFIFNMLKGYGKYKRKDIDELVTNNNRNTIKRLAKK